MYSIKDLERLSGHKAHTIRIWEKRYELLEPKRTDTNIRYYDDDQLRKILNVSTLLAHGGKISKISKLKEIEIAEAVEQLMAPTSTDDRNDAFINRIIEASMTYDEQLFEGAFAAATLRLGLNKCYALVVLPALIRLGLMWGKNTLMPAQEHFISNLIKQKLFAAIDGLPAPDNASKKYLLFLPEKEEHEIGLLFANYLIKQRGHLSYYLGQNVPSVNLEAAIHDVQPDYILLFMVRTWNKEEAKELFGKLNDAYKNKPILLCGSSQPLNHIESNKHLIKINKIEDLYPHI